MVANMQASLKIECMNCGKEFLARRGTAKFCSAGCRKAWSRRSDRIDSEITAIQVALSNLTKYAEKWSDLQKYIDESLIKPEITSMLKMAIKRMNEAK